MIYHSSDISEPLFLNYSGFLNSCTLDKFSLKITSREYVSDLTGF